MRSLAIVLFALAALGGIVLAVMRARGRLTLPIGLALVHGILAAAGLAVLIGAVAMGFHARAPLVLFLVAAVGGFVLFSFQLRSKPIPIGVMVVHAIVAVVGFLLLLSRI